MTTDNTDNTALIANLEVALDLAKNPGPWEWLGDNGTWHARSPVFETPEVVLALGKSIRRKPASVWTLPEPPQGQA